MVSTCNSGHSEIDQAIGRHGEPQVVRVRVPCILRIGVNMEVFFVSVFYCLSVDLDFENFFSTVLTSFYYSIHQHISSSGGDVSGNSVRKCRSLIQIGCTDMCERNRSPVEWAVLGWWWICTCLVVVGGLADSTKWVAGSHRLVLEVGI